MNIDYIKKRLEKERVPEKIINDTIFFFKNYGWRMGPSGAIYIIGLERTHIDLDYYWICVDRTMTLKYVSVCCDISHDLMIDGNIMLNRNQIDDIQRKIEKANFDREVEEILIWFFSSNISGDTFKYIDVEGTAKSELPKETKEFSNPNGKVIWDKDLLTSKQKNILMDYAISKLNAIDPLTIKLSQLETLRYHDFCDRHRNCVSGKFGANGGGISLKITGTGLGWCFDCICNGCGEKENITDISNW